MVAAWAWRMGWAWRKRVPLMPMVAAWAWPGFFTQVRFMCLQRRFFRFRAFHAADVCLRGQHENVRVKRPFIRGCQTAAAGGQWACGPCAWGAGCSGWAAARQQVSPHLACAWPTGHAAARECLAAARECPLGTRRGREQWTMRQTAAPPALALRLHPRALKLHLALAASCRAPALNLQCRLRPRVRAAYARPPRESPRARAALWAIRLQRLCRRASHSPLLSCAHPRARAAPDLTPGRPRPT
jgi:hypothetical protein